VLDQATTARSVSVVPPPAIGREWFGRARDLRRRVEREDTQFIDTIHALLMPAQLRLVRYPHRKLRPEMLIDLVQGWRFMGPRDSELTSRRRWNAPDAACSNGAPSPDR
jgi:hypothetical protein